MATSQVVTKRSTRWAHVAIAVGPKRGLLSATGALSVLFVIGQPAILTGQTDPTGDPPTAAEIERVGAVHSAVAAVAAALGDELWPGFRPSEAPVLYTGLSRSVLVGWPGEPPEGFRRADGLADAAWSPRPNYPILIGGGTTLTSVDLSYSLPTATALAMHEHFHGHQRRMRTEGAAFAGAERPAAVRLYPVFDTLNTILVALEGRLLSEALVGEEEQARSSAQGFLAVRMRRRARLPEEAGRWEQLTERHEGLADYVGIRALEWLAEENYSGWGPMARQDLDQELARLTELVELAERSLRYRYYATGSAQALVLDRFSPGWKDRLVAGDWTLDDLLSSTLGVSHVGADDTFVAVTARDDFRALRGTVPRYLSSLAERREILVDSLLSAQGFRIQVKVDEGAEICGLDPLNVRHVPGNRIVHPAFVAVCAPDQSFNAQFSGPTVEDLEARTFTVMIDRAGEVEVLTADEPLAASQLVQGLRVEGLSLTASSISLTASGQAWVQWTEGAMFVRLAASAPARR